MDYGANAGPETDYDALFDDLPEPAQPTEPADDAFDGALSDDLTGLVHVGALSTEFSWIGHLFTLRTLRSGEDLAIAQVVEPYRNTLAQARALAIAQVGAHLMLVDGRPIVQDLGPDPLDTVRRKFDYLRRNWSYTVVERVFLETEELRLRERAALAELEGKS